MLDHSQDSYDKLHPPLPSPKLLREQQATSLEDIMSKTPKAPLFNPVRDIKDTSNSKLKFSNEYIPPDPNIPVPPNEGKTHPKEVSYVHVFHPEPPEHMEDLDKPPPKVKYKTPNSLMASSSLNSE